MPTYEWHSEWCPEDCVIGVTAEELVDCIDTVSLGTLKRMDIGEEIILRDNTKIKRVT